ncbi:hypothetical protein L484_001036 [Morus notabilis]|uniref:Uncharacterized protein n=1 Tax=Morus notabilis TaxID=981085 RepID=W9RIQ9_9ROSA|nr:hypothetical protein L484_001036 [Morus notabilis]
MAERQRERRNGVRFGDVVVPDPREKRVIAGVGLEVGDDGGEEVLFGHGVEEDRDRKWRS